MKFSQSALLLFLSLTDAYPVNRIIQQHLAERDSTPNTTTSMPSKSVQLDFSIKNSFTEDVVSVLSDINEKSVVTSDVDANISSDAVSTFPSNLEVVISNKMSQYVAQMYIGSNKQAIEVDIDTGSSDLWVPASGTTSGYGTFDKSTSTTYKKIADGFSIKYSDSNYAKGEWGEDTVYLGSTDGLELRSFQFAVATNQTAGKPILGLGLKGNEMTTYITTNSAGQKVKVTGKKYDNFPFALKDQGIIDKVSYSVYLNSKDASSGTIIFGEIDTSKYQGTMKTFDLIKVNDANQKVTGDPVAFFANLGGIKDADGNVFTSTKYPALLDSGTTLISAPQEVQKAVVSKYGRYDLKQKTYLTDCDTGGPDFTFTFTDAMDGTDINISVPFKNFLYPLSNYNYNGKAQCLLGFSGNTRGSYILGDAFLRLAYVYYDLENFQLGIAQAKF